MKILTLKNALIGGLLTLSAATMADVSNSVQATGNGHTCCLAAEWTMGQPDGSASAPAPVTGECQTGLANLSCCVGAEWTLAPEVQTAALPADALAEEARPEPFCCLASEHFAE